MITWTDFKTDFVNYGIKIQEKNLCHKWTVKNTLTRNKLPEDLCIDNFIIFACEI